MQVTRDLAREIFRERGWNPAGSRCASVGSGVALTVSVKPLLGVGDKALRGVVSARDDDE